MDRAATPAGRMAIALELFELAESAFRARLRREHPRITRSEIDARVREWRTRRPSPGDAPGKVVKWPRARTRSKPRSAKR